MFKTPLTNAGAENFLQECEGIKEISYKKYIEESGAILSRVKNSTIKNKWQLYCIICEVVTEVAPSIDARDRQLQAIINRMHKKIKSVDEKIEKVEPSEPTPDEGVSLADVAQHNTPKLPEGVLCLELNDSSPKLTIDRQGKRKFVVKMGDTELQTFRKYRQASKFIQKAA